jgi:hypothetical protein
MSNLTAVKRPDKNGKLVTRHVKVDQSGVQQKGIPAPPTPAPATTDASDPVSQDEYLSGLAAVEAKVSMARNIKLNLTSMAKHSPEGFREVIEEFTAADDYKAGLWGYMLDWPNKDTARYVRGLLTELHIMETVAELRPDPVPKEQTDQPVINRGYRLWSSAKLSIPSGTPRTVRQYKATVFALWAKRLMHAEDRIDFKKELDNLNYIGENFDAVMASRYVIRERGTINRDFIESVVMTNAPAISEGVL